MSMKDVLSNTIMFIEAKSLMEKKLEAAGAILVMSPKFHAELAGVGIEYDFGRQKWYYKKHGPVCKDVNQMKYWSIKCGEKDVITLHHTRSFGRRSRDFERAYDAGAKGLASDVWVKALKCHRAALDTDFQFIAADVTGAPVTYTFTAASD